VRNSRLYKDPQSKINIYIGAAYAEDGLGPLELPERDGRGVQGPGTNSPWRADPRLLVIPTSCSRVAESNLNYDRFLGFAPTRAIASHCAYHCNTCVAQPIRVMKT